MKHSHHFIISLLCFFLFANVTKANNDWKPVPFLSGKIINGIARVDSFLLVSCADRDSSFIRINLYTNQVKIIKNDLGKLFGTNGYISLTNIGKHLLYKNNDTLYISHNYGDTWTRNNFLSGADITNYAEQNLFFVGLRGGVFISRDFGTTFSNLYTEQTSSYQSCRPLAIVNNRIFIKHANGLRSVHLDSQTVINYPTALAIFNMVKINDNRLVASVAGKIYVSTDQGQTWTERTQLNSFVHTLVYDEEVVYASATGIPVQYSMNKGESFNLLAYGMPTNTTTYHLAMDSAFVYGGSDNGVFRKNKSSYVPRNIVATAFFDANQNGYQDPGENPIMGQKILSKQPYNFFTNENGQYLYRYIFVNDSISIPSSYAYLTSTKSKLPANFVYHKLGFPFVANSVVRNLGLSVIPLNNSNSNQTNTYAITLYNEGTKTDTARFNLSLSPSVQILSATDTACTFNANMLQLQTILKPFDRKKIWITTQVNTPVNNTDTLWVNAAITPSLNDVDSANNYTKFYEVNNQVALVAQQWAIPMDSIPVEFITNKNRLEYVFRYRHDKTDTTNGATFEVTFPSSLQKNTLKLLGCSHNCSYYVMGDNFTFGSTTGIQPVISNEREGTFYIHFSILPDSTLKENDLIVNRATMVRFPHNDALTNSYATRIYKKSSLVSAVNESTLPIPTSFYPNPATNYLIIKQGTSINVTNMLGEEQTCTTQKQPDGTTILDIAHLKSGMYLISVDDKILGKFIKQTR